MLINEGETCFCMYFIVKGALMAHSTHNKEDHHLYFCRE